MMKTISERFWEKVSIGQDNECWIWKGAKIGRGYGYFRTGKKCTHAHRFAYEYTYGAIPNELKVLHKCDNPLCVNPNHLFLGTNKDNTQDMITKGRRFQPPTKGENNGNAKLSQENIDTIRNLYFSGVRQKELVKLFGISRSQISKIINFETWKDETE